jgi:hypothetical protein
MSRESALLRKMAPDTSECQSFGFKGNLHARLFSLSRTKH